MVIYATITQVRPDRAPIAAGSLATCGTRPAAAVDVVRAASTGGVSALLLDIEAVVSTSSADEILQVASALIDSRVPVVAYLTDAGETVGPRGLRELMLACGAARIVSSGAPVAVFSHELAWTDADAALAFVAARRHVPLTRVRAAFERPLTAGAARAAGLIDAIAAREDVLAQLVAGEPNASRGVTSVDGPAAVTPDARADRRRRLWRSPI